MIINYFNFIQKLTLSKNNIIILTGEEPLQTFNISKKIANFYKQKLYEFHEYSINNQNYNFLENENANLSLFATNKYIKINIDTLPQKTAQNLLHKHLIDKLNTDNTYFINFGDIKKTTQNTKWFKNLSQNALHIQIYNPDMNNAHRILKLETQGLDISREAINIIIEKTAGNLVASKQIINFLHQQQNKVFDEYNIEEFLHKHTCYNVFDLSTAFINRNLTKTLNILNDLLIDRSNATLILWSLKRDLRLMRQLKKFDSQDRQKVFRENNIWSSKQSVYNSLAIITSEKKIEKSLHKCLEIDKSIKGISASNLNLLFNDLVFYFMA